MFFSQYASSCLIVQSSAFLSVNAKLPFWSIWRAVAVSHTQHSPSAMTHTQKRSPLFWIVLLWPHHSLPMGSLLCGLSLRVRHKSQFTTASGREGKHTTAKRGSLGTGGLQASSSCEAACCPCHSTNPWANTATPAPPAREERKLLAYGASAVSSQILTEYPGKTQRGH